MTKYVVMWIQVIEAESPRDAARKAKAQLQDDSKMVFEVSDEGMTTMVDASAAFEKQRAERFPELSDNQFSGNVERESPVEYKCDNCGHVDTGVTLIAEISHYSERVDEGGPEPDGECSECGCLSYSVE